MLMHKAVCVGDRERWNAMPNKEVQPGPLSQLGLCLSHFLKPINNYLNKQNIDNMSHKWATGFSDCACDFLNCVYLQLYAVYSMGKSNAAS